MPKSSCATLCFVVAFLSVAVGCGGQKWRQVDSASGLFSFEYPDGWQVSQESPQAPVSYEDPDSESALTVSGYFGIDSARQITDSAFRAIVGRAPRPNEWQQGLTVGSVERYTFRHVDDDLVTEALVLYANGRVVFATLHYGMQGSERRRATYDHILASVRLHPSASPSGAVRE